MPSGSVDSTDNGVPVIADHKADIEKWLRNNTFFKRVNQKRNITPLETTKTHFLSQYLTNLMHRICITISFISCLYMFRAHVLIIKRSKLH